jgi:hypothetical protein
MRTTNHATNGMMQYDAVKSMICVQVGSDGAGEEQ